MSEFVMMPKELSDDECRGFGFRFEEDGITKTAAIPADVVKSIYGWAVSEKGQPLPDHGWNDAIRAALAAVNNSGGNACSESCGAGYTSTVDAMDAVGALLDQQPEVPK